MKKLIPVFAITVLLLFQAIVNSYGKENNGQKNSKAEVNEVNTEIKQNNGKSEIKIKSEVESETTEIESNENKNRIKFLEKKNDEFKIWEPIQSFTSSSITINGKTINYGTHIEIEGTIAVGKYAKVEGENKDGIMTAEEIVVDNRNKVTPTVSISITPTASVTPTITESVTPTVSVTPEVSGTPTVTPSETPIATETSTLQISSGDAFILDKMILDLQNLLRRLLHMSNE